MLHPRDTPAAQSAQPWRAPEIGSSMHGIHMSSEGMVKDCSCATCMSFVNRTCTDPQSIFANETRHPGSCCPCWARGSG